jgi:hypothetical protein
MLVFGVGWGAPIHNSGKSGKYNIVGNILQISSLNSKKAVKTKFWEIIIFR